MVRLRLLLLALLLSSPVLAEDWQAQPIGPFGGLNNRDNSFAIPANQAQDLLNVNITNGGKSVKKRSGYAQAFALSLTTAPVHGTYLFYNSAGNDVALYFSDRNISASITGAPVSTIYSTATTASTFQCGDYQGSAYCVDSSRDALFKTDGTTVGTVSITSTGTMVTVCATRLAMAGFSSTPNRIDFSADADFTTWGTGSLGSSAVQLTVTAPGASIRHITYAFGRLMWFKESSFGYVIIGNQAAQSDWVIKTVSNQIGTLDNSSTQDTEGNLYFRGQDGHIYAYDGSTLTKISREISGSVAGAQPRSSNLLTLTSATDWTNGTLSGPGSSTFYVDTQTVSGNLQTTFPDTFDAFRDGTSSTKQAWVQTNITSGGIGYGVASVSSGKLNISDRGTGYTYIKTAYPCRSLTGGATIHLDINSVGTTTTNQQSNIFLDVSSTSYSGTTLESGVDLFTKIGTSGNGMSLFMYSTDSIHLAIQSLLTNSATYTIGHGPEVLTLPVSLDLYVTDTYYDLSYSGTRISSRTWSGTTKPDFRTSQYVYLDFDFPTGSPTISTATFDNFSVLPETFTWVSVSQSISSSISSWDTFTATDYKTDGTLTYALRSASTDTYTSITSGNTPTINRTTYWQVVSTFSMTATNSTPAPMSLSSITQNWFEGYQSDKAYATFFDDKIWWSVPIGSGQTTNNRILIYDLLFQGWTLYDLPVNGFYIRNNALYFGSSSGGYIYKFGSGNNDAGAAINAYWKSKDFFGGNPFTNQELANISIAAQSVANSSMTVTYTRNGSSSTAYTMGLGGGTGFINQNKNLPAGIMANEYNVKFGNNAADQPFEVFGIQVGIRPKSWVPTN